jgi:hypothetical protein
VLNISVKGEGMEIEIPMYHDVWMDNGVITLYNMLENNPYVETALLDDKLKIKIKDKKNFIKHLSQRINDLKNEALIVKVPDKITKVMKEVKKDFILIQERKKIGGIVDLKDNIFGSENEDIIENVLNGLDNGKKKCILCERNYKNEIKKLQQANYPFVTKAKSMGGIRGFAEYFSNLCPLCYLIGITEWTDKGIVYRVFPSRTAGKAILFLPYVENFKETEHFKEIYTNKILNYKERYSSIRTIMGSKTNVEYTPGEYSTLLAFYEKFLENMLLEEEENKDMLKLGEHNWNVLISPLGGMKNIKFNKINITDDFIKINLSLLQKNIYIYSQLIRNVMVFDQNGLNSDLTSSVKETLCKAFMLDDFKTFAHGLLPKGGTKVNIVKGQYKLLDKLLIEWRLKKMGFKNGELNTIKSVGNIVAKVSERNIGGLYRLDKARTLDAFWKELKEVSKRIISLDDNERRMIKPTSIDNLIEMINKEEKNWKEIRDLLITYSSMYYTLGKYKKEGKE